MIDMFEYIDEIRKRMSDEDKRFYDDIFAPKEMAVTDEDAWNHLCVTNDGKIRYYGTYGKKSVYDFDAPKCYIESVDGGLTWKRHFQKPGTLGASVKIPYGKYKGKYMGYKVLEINKSFVVTVADDPDSEPTVISPVIPSGGTGDLRLPLFLASRERVLVIVHETREEIHPTCYFVKVYYSDDCGETWSCTDPGIAPMHEKTWPHKGYRWQQNFRENTIAELSDGTLMMLARTATDFHHVSFSYDGGESWTTPTASAFHGTGTMPTMRRLSDGRIVLCWCNTKLMPENSDADGIWEDFFTNRDANHAAISEDDGKTWIGFREMVLNHIRHNPDLRSYGGPETSRDKSVHQFELLELPYNKMLVAYGQHYACRRIIIFDIDWLYETKRIENLTHGFENLSAQSYVKSISGGFKGQPDNPNEYAGHCAYNRINSVLLVPNPYEYGKEALSFRTNDDDRLLNNLSGATWNFPIASKGRVTITARIGGKGLRVSLFDHWFNPTDNTAEYFADYSILLRPDMHSEDGMEKFVIEFDCQKNEATVSCGEYLHITHRLNNAHPYGLCYLHMQNAAGYGESDKEGSLVARLEYEAL